MSRKRVYIPEKKIKVNPKWIPKRYRGKIKEFSFSLTDEERAAAMPPGFKFSLYQIDVLVAVVHAMLDKLDRAGRKDLKELSHAVRLKLADIDQWLALQESKPKHNNFAD